MNKLALKLTVVALLLLCVGVCQAGTAPKIDMLVQTDWLAAHLNDSNLVVLHVGETRNGYDAGHIAGARFISWSDITVQRNGVPNQVAPADQLKTAFEKAGVGDASTIVVYGDAPLHASFAYFVLDYLGQDKHLAMLDGGLTKWKAEQRALTVTIPAVKTATLTVKPRAELIVDLAGMQKIAAEKKTLLIDARNADMFSGKVPGEGIKRGGHIPGAKNVFWQQMLVSKDNPVLKPVADIKATYEKAGSKPDETAVIYCRTGMMATHDYFTMKLAGLRPVIYSGSFLEWSNAPGTSVDTATE